MYEIKKVKTPEFIKLYKTYYAMKYSDYYFRQNQDTVIEKLDYMDSNYIVLQNGDVIGGGIMKANYLSDCFVVPPFTDYQIVVDQFVKYLKVISDTGKKTLIYEVVEENLDYYTKYKMTYGNVGHWMIRPTQYMEHHLDSDYSARCIKENDIEPLAELIHFTYSSNSAFKSIPTKENLLIMLQGFLKGNVDTLNYKNSLVIVDNLTGDLVGVSTHMIFEELPLITEIAVHPDHQGKGLGSFLLKHSTNGYHGSYDGIRLYVFKENNALSLYEKMGFIKNRTINDVFIDIE